MMMEISLRKKIKKLQKQRDTQNETIIKLNTQIKSLNTQVRNLKKGKNNE